MPDSRQSTREKPNLVDFVFDCLIDFSRVE